MIVNNLISKIRKWPIEKKRIFSISLALFFTVLVIILNFVLNMMWKAEEPSNRLSDENSSISDIQESFSKIFQEAKPALDQIFSSSTDTIPQSPREIIDQINSTSTSFSTTSDVVR
jgi:predicted PurR-regulated permease PerM